MLVSTNENRLPNKKLDEELDAYWNLIQVLRRAKEQTEQLDHPFCAQHDLTPMQFRVLMALYMGGPQTVSTLAKQTCMAGANNSALCKRLAQDGYVLRQRAEADERHVVISLAPPGEEVVQIFIKQYTHKYRQLIRSVSPQDVQIIQAGFDRLASILENDKEITQ